jgi:hypothetical protein
MPTSGYKTSEAQRRASSKYRINNKDKAAKWSNQWYRRNKAAINLRRRQRYREKKLEEDRKALEAICI